MAKQKLVVVVGPTASGKTNLAINIANAFNGEVVSADSRQVYRRLDIGTAKITKEEMQGIPHHLIDIVDIDTIYTAAHFKRDASKAIAKIVKRGHVPVLAGGTFFYIDTLLERVAPPKVSPNPKLRAELEKMEAEELYKELQKKDERRAIDIDPQNKRRLVRALEIIHELGEVPELSEKDSPYNTLILGIQTDPEDLKKKLTARAEEWLTGGLIEEVQVLLESGVKRDRLTEIGFEYMLGVDYLEGKLNDETFVETCVQKNWQYAKRQLTWLKRDKSINWVSPADKTEVEIMIKNFLIN